MRIGLDLDNTIVCYDSLFRDLAVAQRLVDSDTPPDKTAVRDAVRSRHGNDVWTELQGEVYGQRMMAASLFPGVAEFLQDARRSNHRLVVISHRTRWPVIGPPCDLHEQAAQFLQKNLSWNDRSALFFETTREAKLARIAEQRCDVFVDDLPEFLMSAGFPPTVRRIWFNPHGRPNPAPLESLAGWSELSAALGWREPPSSEARS